MKQIKFRAWQKYHKRMVEVTSISFDDNGEINGVATFVENQAPQHINYRDDLLGGFFLKDERGMVLELMQYTGLKDKNGFEIFEGDIVRGENKAHEKELIVQKFGTTYHLYEVVAGVEVAKRPYCRIDSRATYNDFSSSETDLEVIGNIYENSDLLEESD